MKKNTVYVCQECGATFLRWVGKCTECSAWNTVVEEVAPKSNAAHSGATVGVDIIPLSHIEVTPVHRIVTHNDEFDRAVGGGIVRGSVILLGGDPGIGKSTISLQLAARLADLGHKTLYISGEESASQLSIRAERLAINMKQNIDVICDTDIDAILPTIADRVYHLIIVDSIQTLASDQLDSPPGSIGQLRECTAKIVSYAKKNGVAAIIVGHVNKDGAIAGPKIIEHMVDTVLYFEGKITGGFRIIRTIKNRFGSTNEIGIFEMLSTGLESVANPSRYFINQEEGLNSSGSVAVAAIEGTRPIIQEIQALVGFCPPGIPRRTAMGIDGTKLAIIVAVMEKRLGLKLYNQDIYVKVVGGVKLDDPACDLAIACAIYSSLKNTVINRDMMVIGELGLSGELRNVPFLEIRLKEMAKFGIKTAYIPKQKSKILIKGLTVTEVATLSDVIQFL